MSVSGSSVLEGVVPPSSEASGTSILARPKSRIFACPPGATMMFAGLRYRCTIPLAWATAHELLQRRPVHVLEDDVVEPLRLAEVVDALDVGVVEGGAEDRLALEAPPGRVARGEVGPE